MWSCRITFLTILILSSTLVILGDAASENITCSSVAAPNLQNAEINNIKFVHGKAYTSDRSLDKSDWEYTISKDVIYRPTPEKEIRLVVLNANHLTGSGAWDTVLVFDCFHGKLRKIFESRYFYGVKIVKKTDAEIILISGEWQPGDPLCCPSKEKKEIYRWNSSKNTYILESASASHRD